MNKIKTMIVGILIAAVCFGGGAQAVQAETSAVPVYLNDELLQFNIDPILESDTTLVEFRPIFEKLGLEIAWNAQTKTITGSSEGLTIVHTVDSKTAYVNGEEFTLQSAPKIYNERTLVPIRFVGEAAGSYVKWDSKTRVIHIYRIAPETVKSTNNYVWVEGRVPANIRYLLFELHKSDDRGDFSREYVEVFNGRIRHQLYLAHGAGNYNIRIFQTTGFDRTKHENYEYNTTINVINEGLSGLTLSGEVTDNSSIGLYGEVEETVQTVIAGVTNKRTSETKWAYYEPTDNKLDTKIYLSLGEGEYEILLYTTNEELDSRSLDNAELFRTYTVTNNDTRDRYLVPSEYIESDHPDIIALAESITKDMPSDSFKSRAIHNWVTWNIAYDADTYFSGGDRMDSALETLQRKLTDCDGYARLNVALHRAAGIKARIVVGMLINPDEGESWDKVEEDAVNHAWNEVYYNDRWVIQDPTLNAGYIDPDKKIFVRDTHHQYYDPHPVTFARDHRAVNLNYIYE